MIIQHSRDAADTSVLHSSILSAVSDRFGARMGGRWGTTATEGVVDSASGKSVTLYRYKLLFDECGYTMNDQVQFYRKRILREQR